MEQDISIVKLSATWCRPCKIVDKILDRMEDVYVTHIDIDEEPDFCNKYSVSSIPTLLFFVGEDLKERLVGVVSEKQIREVLESLK